MDRLSAPGRLDAAGLRTLRPVVQGEQAAAFTVGLYQGRLQGRADADDAVQVPAPEFVEGGGRDGAAGGGAGIAVQQRHLAEEVAGDQGRQVMLAAVQRARHPDHAAGDQEQRIALFALSDHGLAGGHCPFG